MEDYTKTKARSQLMKIIMFGMGAISREIIKDVQ